MSLMEGKDNLAYRNYKMSDEFKKRLLDNYSVMLNDSNENERKIVTVNNDKEGILNFEDYKILRDDGLPIKKNKHKVFDGFIKIAVASFAVVASAGVIKTGINSYMNKDSKTKEAHGKIEKAEVKNSVETTSGGGILDFVLNGFSDAMDAMGDSSDFYDEDGQLKEGYESKELTYELNGVTYNKTIIGKDIVEISEDEYAKNFKLSTDVDVEVNKYSYVYYIQGNDFCRTTINKGFTTERYSSNKVEHLEKYNDQIIVYMQDYKRYEENSSLSSEEFFWDVNIINPCKITFTDGNQNEDIYFKEKSDVELGYDGEQFICKLYIIDAKDNLLCVESVKSDDLTELSEYNFKWTGIIKKDKNFKITKLAEHVAFDRDEKYSDLAEKIEGDTKTGSSPDKVYFKLADGYDKIIVKSKNSNVKYKGIDY